MVLSFDLLNLLLYCAQQLGVTLGVGSMTILLVAYLQAMRDGVVDIKEAQFSRAVRAVLNIGLLFIILSGVGITALHIFLGGEAVVLTPAYLFKWLLIFLVLGFAVFESTSPGLWAMGFIGGTWYALFVVHILAPVTSWINLVSLYAVWMAGFVICWAALAYSLRGKKVEARASTAGVPPASAFIKTYPPILERKITPPPVPIKPKVVSPSPPVAPAPQPPLPTPPAPQPVPKPLAPAAKPIPAVPTVPMPSVVSASNTNTLPLQKDPLPAGAMPAPQAAAANLAMDMKNPDKNPGLPAVQVMPKTPQDLENQNRATLVVLE